MPAVLAVRFKGGVDVREDEKLTLKLIRLERPMTATLLADNPTTRGMLRRVQHLVAWASVDATTVKLLLEKRGEISRTRRLTTKALKAAGLAGVGELAKDLADGNVELHKIPVVKPIFRLSPPRGGFKARKSRLAQEGGIFGHNPGLLEIVKRMV